jgi:hypothetical protein
MSRFDRLRGSLTYANVMATIAMFLALGGGAYAVSVPRNSVGTSQLKGQAVTAKKIARNAVLSASVKDNSLMARDFRSSQLPRLAGAHANDADPATGGPRVVLSETRITLKRPGMILVLGTLRDTFMTCAAGPCSAQWGIYVDDEPIADTGLILSGNAGDSDGHSYDVLHGTTVELPKGDHTVKLARVDAGQPDSAGQLSAAVSTVAVN